MGPIIFYWVACGVSLVALVEVMCSFFPLSLKTLLTCLSENPEHVNFTFSNIGRESCQHNWHFFFLIQSGRGGKGKLQRWVFPTNNWHMLCLNKGGIW
jgi:hypothetical protein